MVEFQGSYLKELREARGYSQEMLARMMAVKTGRKLTRGAVCNWEKARSIPEPESLLALSRVFHVRVEDFFLSMSNY